MRLNEVLKLAEVANRFCNEIFGVHGCEDGIEGFTMLEIVNMTDFYVAKYVSGDFEGTWEDQKMVVNLLKQYNGYEVEEDLL